MWLSFRAWPVVYRMTWGFVVFAGHAVLCGLGGAWWLCGVWWLGCFLRDGCGTDTDSGHEKVAPTGQLFGISEQLKPAGANL